MDRFWLTFQNEALEHEYSSWLVRRVQWQGDLEFLWVALGICCLSSLQNMLMGDSWLATFLAGVNTVCLIRQIVLRKSLNLKELTNRRTRFVLQTRILLQLTTCAARAWTIYRVTNFLRMIAYNGTILVFLFAFCCKLKFSHHLPYQLIASFAMLFTSVKEPCSILMERHGGTGVKYVARMMGVFAKRIMSPMSKAFGIELDAEPSVCPCLHVMAWMHSYVILILTSYILWKLERSSRRAFVRSLPDHRRKKEGLTIVGTGDYPFIILIQSFVLVTLFGAMWQLSYGLVDFITSWGI